MKNTYILATAVSVAGVVGAGVLLCPTYAQSKAPSKASQLREQNEAMSLAINKVEQETLNRDLLSAEADAAKLAKAYPQRLLCRIALANVYYAERRLPEAYAIYHKEMALNASVRRGGDWFLRLGDSASATGHNDEAATAYRQVVEEYRPRMDPDMLAALDSPCTSLSDLRRVSWSTYDCLNHNPGYMAEVRHAVAVTPRQPALHYLYAGILAEFGRYGDAYDQVKKAAALLPTDKARTFHERAYKFFGFQTLDHGTKAVVSHGKVTFSRFPMPLPNSASPLVEQPIHSPRPVIVSP
jgi:tetratricopeptide (TPR) repeat protein